MKLKHYIIMIMLIGILGISVAVKESKTKYYTIDLGREVDEQITWEAEWEPLLRALIQVESRGDVYAEGRYGDRGILQITPILVRDVNRIIGENKYKHEDAYVVERSMEMFYIYANKYCPEHDFEKMAKIWHRGPRYKYHGPEVCKQAEAYWKKVQYEMNKYKESNI